MEELLIIWAVLQASDKLMKLLGTEGSQVVSRVASLILMAFGVMLIRHGLMTMADLWQR